MSDLESVLRTTSTNTTSNGFSIAVASILGGLDAENYIPIFKKYNFNKQDMEGLTNEDLVIMGIDSPTVRENIISAFQKSSPLRKKMKFVASDKLSLVKDTKRQIELIKLSLSTYKLTLQKNADAEDILVTPSLYTSDLMLQILDQMEDKLRDMEKTLTLNMAEPKKKITKLNVSKKKLMIAAIGGSVITLLSMCLVKSLKQN